MYQGYCCGPEDTDYRISGVHSHHVPCRAPSILLLECHCCCRCSTKHIVCIARAATNDGKKTPHWYLKLSSWIDGRLVLIVNHVCGGAGTIIPALHRCNRPRPCFIPLLLQSHHTTLKCPASSITAVLLLLCIKRRAGNRPHSRARQLRGPCPEYAAYQTRCCCSKTRSCRPRSRKAQSKTADVVAVAVAAAVPAAAAEQRSAMPWRHPYPSPV